MVISENSSPRRAVDAQALVDAALRRDLASFVRKTFGALNPGTSYWPNWHIEAIAWQLDQVRRGNIKRLIIALPPRSLKSIAASVAFPAFVHGHDPTRQVICVSYSHDLAVNFHNQYRQVLRSPWYRSAFPGVRVSRDKDTETELRLTAHGGRLATSVGGTLTGRGADIIVIDDPLKGEDAPSQAKRDAVNAWYRSTLVSRLNDKRTGAIVIVTQRFHVDDLVGHVLENGADNWDILELPAIFAADQRIQTGEHAFHAVKAGDLLHPEREPRHVLDAIRQDLGSAVFAAQYLQAPVPPEGNMIKRAWLRYYDKVPAQGSGDRIVQSWDTASKTGPENDWSVGTTWLIRDNQYFLLDVVRGKFDYPELRATATKLAKRYKPRMVLVEDAGIGAALAPELRARGINVKPVKVSQPKEVRASVQTAKFEGGRILFPRQAPWLADLEAELLAFPHGRHDDQVDSITQALAYAAIGKARTTTSTVPMY